MSLLSDSTEHWRFSWKSLVAAIVMIVSLAGFYYAIKYDGRATREKFDDYTAQQKEQQKERDKDNKERMIQLTAEIARANDGIESIRQFNALSEMRFRVIEKNISDMQTVLDTNMMQDQVTRERVIKVEYRLDNRNNNNSM